MKLESVMDNNNIIFYDFVRNEYEEPLEQNGDIYCKVMKNGKLQTVLLEKQNLIDSGILPTEISISEPPDNTNDAIIKNSLEAGTSSEYCGVFTSADTEWSNEATKYLLDKYHDYLPEVGPMKRFKIKKKMWEQISTELKITFAIEKTSQQVENRFKTVLKRKKAAISTNKTSGEIRNTIEYENELGKIANLDDSIEPEMLKGQKRIIVNKEVEKNKKPKNDIYGLLKDMYMEKKEQRERHFQEKEERKERRHQEKMNILKSFLQERNSLDTSS